MEAQAKQIEQTYTAKLKPGINTNLTSKRQQSDQPRSTRRNTKKHEWLYRGCDRVYRSGVLLDALRGLRGFLARLAANWYKLSIQFNNVASDEAVELGYFDQAHFINDFKALIGTTPAAYAQQNGAGIARTR
jgi:AraC-like DNA-binding protein